MDIYIYIQVVPAQIYTLCCWLSLYVIAVPFFAYKKTFFEVYILRFKLLFFYYLERMHQNYKNCVV